MTFDKLKARWQLEAQGQKREAAARRAALTRAKPLFARFGVRKAVLFGSVAAGRSRAGSDIDLLVLPLAAAQYWDFKRELEESLAYPVDLHSQDDDPGFVEKVLSRGEVIYEDLYEA
ncbi:MAG: nucleotidyltransferase domain-containing protein [Deinococcota bacterium]|jgi:predicted nucleotidyltransferase|nr:nucleotidyltransferase domain-containing protein [Deinococcota bacterium]